MKLVQMLIKNIVSFFFFYLQASGYDDDGEKIHQSNSFKRIMYSVLGTTDY